MRWLLTVGGRPIEDQKGTHDDEDKAAEDEFEFLNTSQLMREWDNEDPKVITDDEEPDDKNQQLLKNLNTHMVAIIIIKQ